MITARPSLVSPVWQIVSCALLPPALPSGWKTTRGRPWLDTTRRFAGIASNLASGESGSRSWSRSAPIIQPPCQRSSLVQLLPSLVGHTTTCSLRVMASSRACIRLACNAPSADCWCERASIEPSAGTPIATSVLAMATVISISISVIPRGRARMTSSPLGEDDSVRRRRYRRQRRGSTARVGACLLRASAVWRRACGGDQAGHVFHGRHFLRFGRGARNQFHGLGQVRVVLLAARGVRRLG